MPKGLEKYKDDNILRGVILQVSRHLQKDKLHDTLNVHFGMDKYQSDGNSYQVASLYLINTAMLQQRIAEGQWLFDVNRFSSLLKLDGDIIENVVDEWDVIMKNGFESGIEPGLDIINVIKGTGKTDGLKQALEHIVGEIADVTKKVTESGKDVFGALFNNAMSDQASEGAYFTRPQIARLAAMLTLDALEENERVDYTHPDTWRMKVVDLACGSGALLMGYLNEMKERARMQGASEERIAKLHQIAVEEGIKGMDVTRISLDLAASNLTNNNQNIQFRKTGLYLMPYGPQEDGTVKSGSLELLGDSRIVPKKMMSLFGDEPINATPIPPPNVKQSA